jgi:hypothetical protein
MGGALGLFGNAFGPRNFNTQLGGNPMARPRGMQGQPNAAPTGGPDWLAPLLSMLGGGGMSSGGIGGFGLSGLADHFAKLRTGEIQPRWKQY